MIWIAEYYVSYSDVTQWSARWSDIKLVKFLSLTKQSYYFVNLKLRWTFDKIFKSAERVHKLDSQKEVDKEALHWLEALLTWNVQKIVKLQYKYF